MLHLRRATASILTPMAMYNDHRSILVCPPALSTTQTTTVVPAITMGLANAQLIITRKLQSPYVLTPILSPTMTKIARSVYLKVVDFKSFSVRVEGVLLSSLASLRVLRQAARVPLLELDGF